MPLSAYSFQPPRPLEPFIFHIWEKGFYLESVYVNENHGSE